MIGNFIIDFFTPREWASITLIGVFILLSMKEKNVRRSFMNLITIFFHWKIIITILLAQIYLAILTYTLYLTGLWNLTILRESIYFSLCTSILLIFKYNKNSERLITIKNIIIDSIKLPLIICFYLNLHTFSYLGELCLQFFLSFFFLLGTYNKRDNDDLEKVYGCTQTFFYSIIIFQTVYSIYMNIKLWDENFITNNIISLLFPVVATILFWPYLYAFAIISAYEIWFIRIKSTSKGNRDVYLFRRNRILKACKLNLKMIIFVSKDFHIYIPQTQKQFIEDMQKSILKYKKKYHKL